MKKISYSQFSLYHQCPHRWKLDYVDGLRTYEQSIHTLFGTVMHETIQTWLTTIYQQSVKAGNAMDFGQMLKEGLANGYKQSIQEGQSHYSTPQQLSEFYHDGITILEYLRKKRTAYFTTKNIKLVGVEIPLTLQMKNNVQFVGFIDLVMYDEKNDKVKIYDIKTSTGGWNKYQNVERVDVEYIILRRKIDEELEFTPKRIQTFTPASGKPTRNKVVKLLEGFIDACFTSNGEYKVDANHLAIKQKLCNYCPYSNNEQACPKKQRISL